MVSVGYIRSKWIVKIGFSKLKHVYLKYSDCSIINFVACYMGVSWCFVSCMFTVATCWLLSARILRLKIKCLISEKLPSALHPFISDPDDLLCRQTDTTFTVNWNIVSSLTVNNKFIFNLNSL